MDCDAIPGMRDIKVSGNLMKGTQAYTSYDSDSGRIYVSIRGSSNIPNWIENIDVARDSYAGCSGCSVHSGFKNAFNSLQASILANVKQLVSKYPLAEVYVTGHSLGGAIAALVALDLNNNAIRVHSFITFEQPRVGNKAFANYFHIVFP